MKSSTSVMLQSILTTLSAALFLKRKKIYFAKLNKSSRVNLFVDFKTNQLIGFVEHEATKV